MLFESLTRNKKETVFCFLNSATKYELKIDISN